MSLIAKLVGGLIFLSGATQLLTGLAVMLGSDGGLPKTSGYVFLAFGGVFVWLGRKLWVDNRQRVEGRRAALLEGVACPARLKSVRRALGYNLTHLNPDFLHIFDVQMPDGRVVEHRLKLPLNAQGQLDNRDDLLVLVHEASGAIFIPETVTAVRWVD